MNSQVVIFAVFMAGGALAQLPSVQLKNAATGTVMMPISGIGSGGYSGNLSMYYASYPECFQGCSSPDCATPDPTGYVSCGQFVNAAMSTWLQVGGRRIDNSASYHNQLYIGDAVKTSGIPREEIFITSKVGPYLAMGYNDTWAQFNGMKAVMGVDYVDLILIHWPSCSAGGGCTSTPAPIDPLCQFGAASYNETACRLSTWTALVEIWQAGGARAIGVSNYNQTHLQEIMQAGMPLPAVNQCPFNLYHSAVQLPLLAFCKANNIVFNGYSPFGVPDRNVYPAPFAPTPLQDPVLISIAQAHNRSPAEITLAWQWAQGIVVNPRSMNVPHMMENLNFYDIQLTADEISQLNSRPQK